MTDRQLFVFAYCHVVLLQSNKFTKTVLGTTSDDINEHRLGNVMLTLHFLETSVLKVASYYVTVYNKKGYWSISGYANSWIANAWLASLQIGHIAVWRVCRLVMTQIGH